MLAFHWYSETPFTRMNVRVAVTAFVSQVPPATPYLTVALVDEMSVAQLTITACRDEVRQVRVALELRVKDRGGAGRQHRKRGHRYERSDAQDPASHPALPQRRPCPMAFPRQPVAGVLDRFLPRLAAILIATCGGKQPSSRRRFPCLQRGTTARCGCGRRGVAPHVRLGAVGALVEPQRVAAGLRHLRRAELAHLDQHQHLASPCRPCPAPPGCCPRRARST